MCTQTSQGCFHWRRKGLDGGRGQQHPGLYLVICTDKKKESFLLRTRNSKMPYKHIAAHLQKTELACRLHYHQMTFGNNRRRRANSASCVRNSVGLVPNSDPSNKLGGRDVRMLPGSSPPSTPKMAQTSPRANRT